MKHKLQLIILLSSLLVLALIGTVQAQGPGDPTPTPSPLNAADFVQLDLNQIQQVFVPPVAGGYTIAPGNLGGNTPTDFAPPPDACANAAASYLSEELEVIRTRMIDFDNIVFNNQDEDLVYYALYVLEANELDWANSVYDISSPEDVEPVGIIADGDIVQTGDESMCISNGLLTARFWKLASGVWAIESIRFDEPVDLTTFWPEEAPENVEPGQEIATPDLPILVEGLEIRYLMPYIEPPITTLPGGNTDEVAPSEAQLTTCERAAPSYLSIGMDVWLNGYGYEKVPTNYAVDWEDWEFSDTQFALGEHGNQVYLDILQHTPLMGIVGNPESVIVSVAELFEGIPPVGTVVDGPFCTAINAEPAIDYGDISEAPDPDEDRFYTWWQIEVNGEVGWYPENVGQYSHWLWETDGIFGRKLFLYYLVPFNAMESTESTCPSSNLIAGTEVQPAFSAMNLRNAPAGDRTGRVEAGQVVTVLGEPVCAGGTIWWQTTAGGYIAEFEPSTKAILLVPAVQNLNADRVTSTPTPTLPPRDTAPTEPTRPTEEARPTEMPEPTRPPQ
jgi:hypothetical protein